MNKEVLVVAQIQVKDFTRYFTEYALPFKEVLEQYEAEVIGSTTEAEVLEGERYGNWTVVLKFPSKEHAYKCIKSDEYAPLAKLRINELTTGGNVIMIPAYTA